MRSDRQAIAIALGALHGILARKVVRALAAAVMIVAPGLLLVASPASADTAPDTPPVIATACESFGHRLCIGAPSLAAGDAVTQSSSSGRTLVLMHAGGPDQWKIAIKASSNPQLCVAATNNDNNAVLHSCSGNYVVWDTDHNGNDPCLLENDHFKSLLTGDNQDGDQFSMDGSDPPSGSEQQFTVHVTSGTGPSCS